MSDFVTNWNKDFLTMPVGPLGIIAMPGCEAMASKVEQWLLKWYEEAEALDDSPLFALKGAGRDNFIINAKCPRFSNGEGKGMITSTIRGYDIYILCDIGAYNVTYDMYGKSVPLSPDDHFQNLKRIIAAIGGKARRINVIMPMLYEGRQHRRASRESLDCAIGLQELTNLGVSNIITFDAHDPRIVNAIPFGGFENIMPYYQILKALLRHEPDLLLDSQHMMIVSPDEGAIDRNIYYSSVLGLNMGMFYKRRDYTKIVNGSNPIVAHEYLGDSVKGKDVLVSDDILASGSSILDLAGQLKSRGCNRVFASVTFPLFTSGLEKFKQAYNSGLICRVISTNLTYVSPELEQQEWFIKADMSKYISYIIASLNHDRSLNTLLNPLDRIKKLVTKYQEEQLKSNFIAQDK